MRHTTYDKQAVIQDIAEKQLSPKEIAEKYGITIGNVYTIKALSIRAGKVADSPETEERILTPDIRDRIKDLRDRNFTTTEITNLLNREGLNVLWEDVAKIRMRRFVGEEEPSPKRRYGRVVRG